MKRIKLLLLAALFVSFAGVTNAQTEKGKVMMGGGFALSSADTDVEGQDQEDSNLLINFTPKIGYFFGDDIAIGLGIEFTHSSVEISGQKEVGTDLIAGPYARYYFPVGENSAFFAELDVVFGTLTAEVNDFQQSTTMYGVGVGPGFTIFSNEFVGVEGLIRYNYISGSREVDGSDQQSISISEIDFLIGIQFYL